MRVKPSLACLPFWSAIITADQIRKCLQSVPSGNRNAYMRYLRAIFNLGIKRGYLAENPILRLDFAERKREEIKPLSNATVKAMLNHALKYRPKLLPFLVLGFFCGLRTQEELPNILWSDIDWENRRVVIRASITKTNRKRLVPLYNAAVEWLRLSPPHEPNERIIGDWTPQQLRKAREQNWQTVSKWKEWPHNAMRDTFASNFAAINSIDDLTLAMGHTSSDLTFQRYVGCVSKEHAQEFFSISPYP